MASGKQPATKAPKGGKGSAILARVTQASRQAIDAEAERTGRSISQVVELWLEQARALQVPGVEAEIQAMARAALEVRNTIGEPSESEAARDKLRASWATIAQHAIPHLPETAAMSAAKAATAAAQNSILAARAALTRSAADSHLASAAKRHLQNLYAGRDLPGSRGWPQVRADLLAAANGELSTIASHLNLVLATAETADLAAQQAGADNERP